jgi:macrodomain Ter protein organizer (MatP/YcbG family)
MAAETATIRVPRETRDRLAARARDRGMSLSSLLTELAERAERTDAYRSEREATRADVKRPEALAEYRLWEETLEDGID